MENGNLLLVGEGLEVNTVLFYHPPNPSRYVATPGADRVLQTTNPSIYDRYHILSTAIGEIFLVIDRLGGHN